VGDRERNKGEEGNELFACQLGARFGSRFRRRDAWSRRERLVCRGCGCLSAVPGAYAQNSGAPAFEVASLKLSAPTDRLQNELSEFMTGSRNLRAKGFVPGDGQRVELHGFSAAELVAVAYRIPRREVVGPSWISDARFDIDALIPSGQTRDKAPEMLLTLLQERLALKAHHEVRRMSGYILSVAEGGPKLKEAAEVTSPPDMSRPIGPGGDPGSRTERMRHCDMSQLVDDLARNLQAPVEDRTGLKGFYEIVIHIAGADMRDEAERPGAFQEAMKVYGLRLASGKIDVPILVVDNLSKTPTPN